MKWDGIDGATTTKGFEKWIELSSFQWGVGRAIGSAARGAATREASEPSISEIVVTKHFDKASAKLYQDSVAGTFDTKVEIKMNTTTKSKTETFLAFELVDCGVSSYSLSSGGDNPMESLSLNFLKVIVTPTPLDKSGQIKKGDVVSYDLLAMKAG